jgi:AraC family transcriptional regulator
MMQKRHMLIEMATGKVRTAVPDEPVLSSGAGPWSGILLEEHAPGNAHEMMDVIPPEHVLILQTNRTNILEWKEEGHYRTTFVHPGQLLLLPAMQPFSIRTRDSGDYLALSVDRTFLLCAAQDLLAGSGKVELKASAALEDALLTAVLTNLKREVEEGYPGGRVYGESLATSLATHLVRHHSNMRPQGAPTTQGLPRGRLREVIDYIHEKLAEDITLNDLAARVQLSPFHFARLFKQSTGLTPHAYLIQRRVERARELLKISRQPTSEIAKQVGFCDQSHLTVHFRRAYGLTPKVFRHRMSPAMNSD